MSEINFYKSFVDGLVRIRKSVYNVWIKEKGWPKTPENEEINHFIQTLTDEQKDILSNLMQEARDGGIHDTLVYLYDEMADGLVIKKENITMPTDPFDSELYYDWVCRCSGDGWPDEKLK